MGGKIGVALVRMHKGNERRRNEREGRKGEENDHGE